MPADLDELLGDTPLDAFVLFSSAAGAWGSPGQSAYAAANAWLDALAEDRKARGLTATSIAWGGWAGEGMAHGAEDALRRQGLRPMAADRAVTALARAAGRRDTAIIVSDVDWSVFVPAYTAARHRPLFDELPEVAAAAEAPDEDEAVLRSRLDRAAPGEVVGLVLDAVRATAAAVLGHPDTSAVEADRAFRDMGFDSLTAVEMRNRCQKLTGVRLPATAVFDHPNPAAFAAELVRLLTGQKPAEDPAEPVLAELDRLEALISATEMPGGRDRVALRLRSLLDKVSRQAAATDLIGRDLGDVSDGDLFDLVDRDLGVV